METIGYTMLDAPQYKILYGPRSPYHNPRINVTKYASLTEQDKQNELESVSIVGATRVAPWRCELRRGQPLAPTTLRAK